MRSLLTVFRFTLKQQFAVKSVRVLTVVLALILFLTPAVTMTAIELNRRPEDPNNPQEQLDDYSAAGVDAVFYVTDTRDGFVWDSLAAVRLPDYEEVPFTHCESLEQAAARAAADDRSLILLLEEDDSAYRVTGLLPEGSRLSLPKADYLAGQFAEFREPLILMESGLEEEQLLQFMTPVRPIIDPADAEDDPSAEPGSDTEGEDEDIPFAEGREILSMFLPYVNIMLLYFLVLYFGQSVASTVILEKTSKLMDTFLVAVKPRDMIFGKVLAAWVAALIQFLSWLLSLIAGFALGTFLVKTINPESPMALLAFFEVLGQMTKLLSFEGILMAALLVAAGFFVYCAMAGIAGSFASKPEELSSTNSIFTLALVASMLITINVGFLNQQMEVGAKWYDFVPFTSTLISPSRVLLGYLPMGYALLSLLASVLLAVLFIRLAGKAYSAMSLYKGNLPKPAEMLKILKS